MGLQQVVKALGKTWHPQCFACVQCHKPLHLDGYREKDGLPYCDADYHALFSPKCAACNAPIREVCSSTYKLLIHSLNLKLWNLPNRNVWQRWVRHGIPNTSLVIIAISRWVKTLKDITSRTIELIVVPVILNYSLLIVAVVINQLSKRYASLLWTPNGIRTVSFVEYVS